MKMHCWDDALAEYDHQSCRASQKYRRVPPASKHATLVIVLMTTTPALRAWFQKCFVAFELNLSEALTIIASVALFP